MTPAASAHAGLARLSRRYYLSMLSVMLMEALISVTYAALSGREETLPASLAANVLFLGAFNWMGATVIFRPVKRYLAEGQGFIAARERILYLPLISTLWGLVVALVFVLGSVPLAQFMPSYTATNEAVDAELRFLMFLWLSAIYAVYVCFIVYFASTDVAGHLRKELHRELGTHFILTPNRLLLRLLVAFFITVGVPVAVVGLDLFVFREIRAMQGLSMKATVAMDLLGSFYAAAIALFFVVRSFLRPITSLMQATQRVRAGHLDTQVPVISNDEFGALTEHFNEMLANLHEREQRLRELADRMTHQALHDDLTGLYNRRHFIDSLIASLAGAHEHGESHSVCYLDLDQFKIVNDTCGHIAGNALLKQLASELHAFSDESNTVARLGGDEFGILLKHRPPAEAEQLAEAIFARIQEHFEFRWEGRSFKVGLSIGIAPINQQSGDFTEVLAWLDLACAMAKDKGGNSIQVSGNDANDDDELHHRRGQMEWVSEINQAFEDERFLLYKQPILPLQPGLAGRTHYELLIRMKNRAGELVCPGQFLPAAEMYGLMGRLDRWVVETACSQLSRLKARPLSQTPLWAINLSGVTLSEDDFLGFIRDQLERHQLPPSWLCFEITETAAIGHMGQARTFIRDLKAMGCRIALDDFGTGLSSFAYLKEFPIDYLKIDGSFIRSLASSALDQSIVRAIAQIAHTLGATTIAEFVESEAIAQQLTEMGVDYGQGHALASPEAISIPAHTFGRAP